VANVAFFENFKFLPKTGFLSYNFVSRCASKSIKDSKDSFASHKSEKTLSEKSSHWAGDQGQAKAPKMHRLPLIVT